MPVANDDSSAVQRRAGPENDSVHPEFTGRKLSLAMAGPAWIVAPVDDADATLTAP
jgi:hypothetical protein